MSPRRNKAFTKESRELALAVHELLRRVRFDDVRTVCDCGITRSECHVLEVVALDGPMSVNDIATRIRVNKSTASRVVQSLTSKKLLRSLASADDARAVEVSVTDRGTTVWQQIVMDSAATYEPIINDLSAAERKVVTKLLGKIAEHATRGG